MCVFSRAVCGRVRTPEFAAARATTRGSAPRRRGSTRPRPGGARATGVRRRVHTASPSDRTRGACTWTWTWYPSGVVPPGPVCRVIRVRCVGRWPCVPFLRRRVGVPQKKPRVNRTCRPRPHAHLKQRTSKRSEASLSSAKLSTFDSTSTRCTIAHAPDASTKFRSTAVPSRVAFCLSRRPSRRTAHLSTRSPAGAA